MICRTGFLSRLGRARDGVAAVEFGFVAVPLCLLLLGTLDFGFESYVRNVTIGAVDAAARAVGVGGATVNPATIENNLRATILAVQPNATVTIVKKSFYKFAEISSGETLVQDNPPAGYHSADGDCYQDLNGNGQYDATGAGRDANVGGADDVLMYTVTVSYPRILPIYNFLGPAVTNTATIKASAVARRQPFDTQQPPVVKCG